MIAGVFLIAIGAIVGTLSYMMGITPMLAMGFASFMIGIMVLYIPDSGGVRESLASDSILPSLLNIEKLLEDLDLDERGIYIPTTGLSASSRVFVPMIQSHATDRPPRGLIHSDRIFVSVGTSSEDRGILLDAPGSMILDSIEQTLRVDLSTRPLLELKALLDTGFRSLGIAKVISLEFEDDTSVITLEMTALIDLETRLRNAAPRVVVQVGTPVTSAVAAAVAKTSGKYARLKNTVLDTARRRLIVSLRLSQ